MQDMNIRYLYVNTRAKSDNVSPNRSFFVQYLTDDAFRRNKTVGPDLKEKLATIFSNRYMIFT
jgi:hypothetical protein